MVKQSQVSTRLTRDEAERAALAVTTLRARTEYDGNPAPHLRRLERRLWELTACRELNTASLAGVN